MCISASPFPNKGGWHPWFTDQMMIANLTASVHVNFHEVFDGDGFTSAQDNWLGTRPQDQLWTIGPVGRTLLVESGTFVHCGCGDDFGDMVAQLFC